MGATVRYTAIQRFCLHDGPGIRTTLFLKGCNLRCPWCANPENVFFDDESPYAECSTDKLAHILIKDKPFFNPSGGVTYSGGEPLLQAKALAKLAGKIAEEGIHQAVETALFANWANIEELLTTIDLFIVDIKSLDKNTCEATIKGNLNTYLKNVMSLWQANKDIIFRMPLVKPYTMGENIELVGKFISQFPSAKLELVPGHNLAIEKYKMIGRDMFYSPPISKSELLNTISTLRQISPDSKIISPIEPQ